MQLVGKSVGLGGENQMRDVRIIQHLLNHNKVSHWPVSGTITSPQVNDQTVSAIIAFQGKFQLRPDGLVGAGGATLQRLELGVTFNPTGKLFSQRVDAFLWHAKQHFGVTIGRGEAFRDESWAQNGHIGHMIRYNSFKPTGIKPKHYKTINGHHLIDWDYLQDANTVWEHVKWQDFLRNYKGLECQKMPMPDLIQPRFPVMRNRQGWKPGYEPDQTETMKHVVKLLIKKKVATSKERLKEPSSAMVAPGYQGCAEPCCCGGNRSRHIDGLAVDLNVETMSKTMPAKFSPQGDVSFNKYLALFGLHRPMTSEPWHVEPTKP